jgi:mono/diheme cytochrome c family protein
MRGAIVAGMMLALTACSSQPAGQAPEDNAQATQQVAVSLYQSDIAPMLTSSCASCHLTGAEAGNMSLVPDKAIATLVGVKAVGAPSQIRVVPGKPDESYVIMKLEGTHIEQGGSGAQMPFGAPPLAPEKIAKLRQWISEGAKP